MADPLSFNPERDVEQALVALKKGTQLIKYSRKGKPKLRPFRLSPDGTTLIWYSRGEERNLKLSAVSQIVPGQRTAVFRRYLHPEKEYLSFSLLYNNGERSLDLICKDKIEAELWLGGLKALISTGKSHNRRTQSDISDLHGDFIQNGRPSNARVRVSVDLSSRETYLNLPGSDAGSGHANMQAKTSAGDGFRVSVSSAASSSQGSGTDDIESVDDVYFWGEVWSGEVSTDGSGTRFPTKVDVLVPKPLESDVALAVDQISCGVRHVALVTRQGEVFTWGEESGGRLGHGNEKDSSRPCLVEFLAVTSVDFVACGEYHTCAVSTSGDLFSWGDGTHHAGLLGHGSSVSHWIPTRVSGAIEGLQVASVACGTWHSALATSDGKLFTFGDGAFGGLGHGDRESVSYPREVSSLSGLRTIKVACGLWHTAAIVEFPGQPDAAVSIRRLFTWGDGDKYQLGHGDKEAHLVPNCVSALVDYNFHQLACGHSITIGLTTSGHVFAMGSAAYGQLGHPKADGKLPSLVQDRLVGEFVEEISCGAYHVAVLTSRREVLTWGRGANGRLGHGDTEDRKTPTLVEALKDRHVKNISCGSTYTVSVCIHKWVSGAEQSVCYGCRQSFGFTRKRRNCYHCGWVHCTACTSKKVLKAALAPTSGKAYRVCDSCYAKLRASEAGASNLHRKATASRSSIDLRDTDRVGARNSRSLFSPTTEPMNYHEVRSEKPGVKSDSSSMVRSSLVPSLSQLKDIAFPSSLTALQYAFSTPQPQPPPPPQPQPQPQPAANSRPPSPYPRRPSPPRSGSPVISRGVNDGLKKTVELLNQEVKRLQNHVRSLKQKCEIQDEEIHKLQKNAHKATRLAADESSMCKGAKDVLKSIMVQLEELKEKLPPEISDSETFKSMHANIEFLLNSSGTHACEGHSSLPADLVYDKSANGRDQTMEDNGVGVRDQSQNGESTPQGSGRSSGTGDAVPQQSTESGARPPRVSKYEGQREVVEQFEPGVYVTLLQLQSGTRIFKRVKFSKRKFAEQQAEDWWKENKDRLLQKYCPPSSTAIGSSTSPLPAEANNEVASSS